MEIDKKHSIQWMNEYLGDDKQVHIKRYYFLLDLYMTFVKEKEDDEYCINHISVYTNILNENIFKNSGITYDSSFLNRNVSKEHKKELNKLYFSNIYHNKENIRFLPIVYSVLVIMFLSLTTHLIKENKQQYVLTAAASVGFLICSIVTQLYIRRSISLPFFLVFRPKAIYENIRLEYEYISSLEKKDVSSNEEKRRLNEGQEDVQELRKKFKSMSKSELEKEFFKKYNNLPKNFFTILQNIPFEGDCPIKKDYSIKRNYKGLLMHFLDPEAQKEKPRTLKEKPRTLIEVIFNLRPGSGNSNGSIYKNNRLKDFIKYIDSNGI